MEPTVFIVDDDEAVLDALAMLVRSVDLPAKTFSSADDFLAAYDPSHPGCLLLDVRMPGMSGIALQKHLAEVDLAAPIVFLTGHGDVPMAVEAIQSGAIDFLMKPFRDQELLDRIHKALEHDAETRREITERQNLARRLDALTPREREVMKSVVEGLTNREIAERLDVSQRTVEIHRSRVMSKTGASSLPELVRMVMVVDQPGPA